jgi:lipid-A-disaccharide synthase
VNLVAEEEVVPELVQGDVTADRLSNEMMTILENTEVREAMKKNLALVRERLGKGGASARTADIALEMIG